MVTLTLLALLACGGPPCGEGYARDAAGACQPVATGETAATDETTNPQVNDSDPGIDETTGDTDTTADTAGTADTTGTTDTAPPEVAPPEVTPLDAPRLLRRVRLDLHGRLPTEADLNAVEADPTALDALLDDYLEDPAFEERLVDLLGEFWQTQTDSFLINYYEYESIYDDPEVEFAFERMVGEEPLRLMARLVADDRPWTDVVQADFTMANDLMVALWPVDYASASPTADAAGWAPATYTDGRPGVGILATNGLWWRYYTTTSNLNRTRAAAIARLLICEDYLARPVTLSESTADASSAEAVREDPYCAGCHSALDPMSAAMFGFWALTLNGPDSHTYHPEREPLGEELLGVAPAWYGDPIEGLAELGDAVAADARFTSCAVEMTAELLWRRGTTLEDFTRLQSLEAGFVAGELKLKALIRAVIAGDVYRAGGLVDGASDEASARENTRRLLSPQQLADAVEALTGFRWTWAGYDQMTNDAYGYRVMSGGVDGTYVTRISEVTNLTSLVVIKRLAEAGADTAVSRELEDGGARALFPEALTLDHIPGDPAFDEALEALHWRLLAQRPEADRLTALSALWETIEGLDGADEAWRGVVTALLRDPDFVSY